MRRLKIKWPRFSNQRRKFVLLAFGLLVFVGGVWRAVSGVGTPQGPVGPSFKVNGTTSANEAATEERSIGQGIREFFGIGDAPANDAPQPTDETNDGSILGWTFAELFGLEATPTAPPTEPTAGGTAVAAADAPTSAPAGSAQGTNPAAAIPAQPASNRAPSTGGGAPVPAAQPARGAQPAAPVTGAPVPAVPASGTAPAPQPATSVPAAGPNSPIPPQSPARGNDDDPDTDDSSATAPAPAKPITSQPGRPAAPAPSSPSQPGRATPVQSPVTATEP